MRRPARHLRTLIGAAALALVATACSRAEPQRVEPLDPNRIRVASFDFPEGRLLAELYGQRLRAAGFAVDVLDGLGTRELVQPALRQGLVDVVIDYTGSLLAYAGGSRADTHGTPEEVHAALVRRLSGLDLTVLPFAGAEDANGFAVRADVARAHQLTKVSDLAPLAGRLTFGGPPECASRPYCLAGLTEVYGLRFAAVRPQPSRAATATALASGEIDVGMLETTYGRLGDRRVTMLLDDRNLQPRENVVPVVRSELVRRYGARLTGPLDEISDRLGTALLIRLNRLAAVDPAGPANVAARYLAGPPS